MLHSRLVSALKKAGASVRELDRGFSHKVDPETVKYDRWFKAELNGNSIDWYTQENWNEKLGRNDGRLAVSFTTWRSPHTDTMTDCHCDSYADTIKRSLWLLQNR
jgi:hypothetical protein